MKSGFTSILLACSFLTAAPAYAQAPSADDIAALKAQIAAMQAQIDKLETQQTAAPVPVAVPAAKVEAPGWWADTKIGGKAYFNVSNISQHNDGVRQPSSGPATELKRFYLTVDHKFNNILSANLTTDFRYGANGTSKDVLIYVKKAYLQAKLSPAFYVRVGSADLPWVPFAEGVYGYRFVENVIIDRTKYGTSADWGVHVGGDLAGGKVSYAVSAINGAGYKTLSRSSDSIDLEGRISVKPIKPLVFAVGGYTGKLGKSVAGQPDTQHRASRVNALAAYVGPRARLGVEYFAAKNWNNVTTVASDKTSGWSAFGSFAFSPAISAFARYDTVNPNKLTNDPQKEHYYNAGIDYTGFKGIDLALVYKHDRANNGLLPTSNGTIGGVDRGTYNEIGLFGQLAF